MPPTAAATYDGYFDTSQECWSVFTEVIGAEFSNAALFGKVHQLTVDAYAVQHVGGRHPDKSVCIHLTGLYLVLERGIPPPSVAPYLQQLASRVHDWPHFYPPSVVWSRTIFDIATADDHAAAVREWAAGVWAGWCGSHRAIAQLGSAHLDVR